MKLANSSPSAHRLKLLPLEMSTFFRSFHNSRPSDHPFKKFQTWTTGYCTNSELWDVASVHAGLPNSRRHQRRPIWALFCCLEQVCYELHSVWMINDHRVWYQNVEEWTPSTARSRRTGFIIAARSGKSMTSLKPSSLAVKRGAMRSWSSRFEARIYSSRDMLRNGPYLTQKYTQSIDAFGSQHISPVFMSPLQ